VLGGSLAARCAGPGYGVIFLAGCLSSWIVAPPPPPMGDVVVIVLVCVVGPMRAKM
jgi:hypothetical protein